MFNGRSIQYCPLIGAYRLLYTRLLMESGMQESEEGVVNTPCNYGVLDEVTNRALFRIFFLQSDPDWTSLSADQMLCILDALSQFHTPALPQEYRIYGMDFMNQIQHKWIGTYTNMLLVVLDMVFLLARYGHYLFDHDADIVMWMRRAIEWWIDVVWSENRPADSLFCLLMALAMHTTSFGTAIGASLDGDGRTTVGASTTTTTANPATSLGAHVPLTQEMDVSQQDNNGTRRPPRATPFHLFCNALSDYLLWNESEDVLYRQSLGESYRALQDMVHVSHAGWIFETCPYVRSFMQQRLTSFDVDMFHRWQQQQQQQQSMMQQTAMSMTSFPQTTQMVVTGNGVPSAAPQSPVVPLEQIMSDPILRERQQWLQEWVQVPDHDQIATDYESIRSLVRPLQSIMLTTFRHLIERAPQTILMNLLDVAPLLAALHSPIRIVITHGHPIVDAIQQQGIPPPPTAHPVQPQSIIIQRQYVILDDTASRLYRIITNTNDTTRTLTLFGSGDQIINFERIATMFLPERSHILAYLGNIVPRVYIPPRQTMQDRVLEFDRDQMQQDMADYSAARLHIVAEWMKRHPPLLRT